MAARELAVGDRVFVLGSYGFEPDWLAASGDRGGYHGHVLDFIPGQNEKPAAVVELDAEIVLPDGAGASVGKEVRGRFLVLELAWVDHDWTQRPTRVQVELCDFRPEPSRWQDRRQGAWVESHATYEIVDEANDPPMENSPWTAYGRVTPVTILERTWGRESRSPVPTLVLASRVAA